MGLLSSSISGSISFACFSAAAVMKGHMRAAEQHARLAHQVWELPLLRIAKL